MNFRKAVFLLYFLFISYLFFQPSTGGPNLFTYQDKIGHFSIFFVLGFLCHFTWGLKPKYLFLMIAYGVSVEIVQALLPSSFHRSFEFLDIIADSSGAILPFFIFKKASF